MIISEKYMFIFLANPKTGSSTLHELLSPYGWRSPIDIYANHLTADAAKRHPRVLGELRWRQFKKVCFIRNPWDRYVALYMMIDKWNGQHGFGVYGSFENYVASGGHQGQHQYEFLLSRQGIQAIDFVGKFENIEHDTRALFAYLKLPPPKTIHHSNNSHASKIERKHYAEYYTKQWMIDAVAEREEHVIHEFDYKFGEDGERWR